MGLASTFYLFDGTGVCKESADAIEQRFIESFSDKLIRRCCISAIKPCEWRGREVFILPGGSCSDWGISSEMQKSLLKWIKEDAGRVFCICAGAYFCSRYSEYNRVRKERIMAVFPGICRGPLISEQIEIVQVIWERTKEQGLVVMIKGGAFVEAEGSYDVLARLSVGPVVSVMVRLGKGKGILSSVHWEFSYDDIKRYITICPELKKQLPDFSLSEPFRKRCLQEMFSEQILE